MRIEEEFPAYPREEEEIEEDDQDPTEKFSRKRQRTPSKKAEFGTKSKYVRLEEKPRS